MKIFEKLNKDPERWHQTDEKTYFDMLGAVPPVAMARGAFLMGEALQYDGQGQDVFACFREIGGMYEARAMTFQEWQAFCAIR